MVEISSELFNQETLTRLFPPQRSDEFFEALFGDAEEGAYDIVLTFNEFSPADNTLSFALELHQRPGKCLACNLTYGLPEVFSRHPLINIAGLVNAISDLLPEECSCGEWRLGTTQQRSAALHVIPLEIKVNG